MTEGRAVTGVIRKSPYGRKAGKNDEKYYLSPSIVGKHERSLPDWSIDLFNVLEIGSKEEHVTPRPWVWVVHEMHKCPDDVQCGARF